MAGPVTDGIADNDLLTSAGVIKVPFPGGIAVVEKPTDSEFPIVVTMLPPQRSGVTLSLFRSRFGRRAQLPPPPPAAI